MRRSLGWLNSGGARQLEPLLAATKIETRRATARLNDYFHPDNLS